MSEKKEKAAILCRPKESLSQEEIDHDFIPGSITQWCSICGAEVFVAPSSQELFDKYDCTIMCTPCGTGVLDTENAPEVMFPTQRQRDELAQMGISAEDMVRLLALNAVVRKAELKKRRKR